MDLSSGSGLDTALAIAAEATFRSTYDAEFRARVQQAVDIAGFTEDREPTADECWAAALALVMAGCDPVTMEPIRSSAVSDDVRAQYAEIRRAAEKHGTIRTHEIGFLLTLAEQGIVAADREAVLSQTLSHTLDTVVALRASLGSDERST